MRKKKPVQKEPIQKASLEVDERKCSECGSRDIGTDEEEKYCKKCGYVFE